MSKHVPRNKNGARIPDHVLVVRSGQRTSILHPEKNGGIWDGRESGAGRIVPEIVLSKIKKVVRKSSRLVCCVHHHHTMPKSLEPEKQETSVCAKLGAVSLTRDIRLPPGWSPLAHHLTLG
jgi:hypothetical protein